MVLLAWEVVAGSGCAPADGPVRIAVFGTVTSEAGDPVSGMISFLPQTGTDGPAATASLIDGTYKFNTKNGPVAGRYRVLVMKELANQEFKGDTVPVTDGPPATGAPRNDEMASEREWSFTADVSPDDVEFDFQIPDAAAAATGG
jgi:hypothetical protein